MKAAMVRAVTLMCALVLPHGVLAAEDNPTSFAKAPLPGEADFCKAYVRALREKDPTSLEELFHPASRETLNRKSPPDRRSSMELRLDKVLPAGDASCRFTPIGLIENFENGGLRYRVQDFHFIYPVPVTHRMAVYVQTAEKPVLIEHESVRLETGRLFLVNSSGSGTDRQSEEFRHFKNVFDIVERNYVEHVDGSRLLKRAERGMIEVSGLAAHVKDGLQKEGNTPSSAHPTSKTIDALLTTIKTVDPGADDAKLYDGAIRGMLKELDERSAYLDRNELNDVYAKQKMAAIGVELAKRDGAVKIISVFPDSAAAEGGLVPGDVIESIDGIPVTEKATLVETAAQLRGTLGSTVFLKIRTTGGVSVSKRLVRMTIKSDGTQSRSIGNGIAYVRILSFASGTPAALKRALADLRSETGAPLGFVLDLRNNHGGLLQAAAAVADEFLAAGRIATIAGRDSQPTFVFDATPNIDYPEREALPMVVLVDEFTASGAEIVAAALQDHRRAVVAGSRTFGMTSVQTLFPLFNGGALKLTTGHFVRVAPSVSADGSVVPDACFREGKVTLVKSYTADRDTSCPKSTIPLRSPKEDQLIEFAVDYMGSTGGKPGS
jgi:carboxyl-terminal processing protease